MATPNKYTGPVTDPEKTADLPPYGSRNPDPITDEAGSHPIETGVGAAVGGALSGLAVGAVAGPIGAAIGAAVGAVAGGLAGKGVGELIDPTTQDNWLLEYFDTNKSRLNLDPDETHESLRPAYQYGITKAATCDRPFTEMESELRSDWEKRNADTDLTWPTAKDAVRDAYERTAKYRKNSM